MPFAPDEPKEIPLAFCNPIVPLVYVVLATENPLNPVAAVCVGMDAVMVPFEKPKETPFELRNVNPIAWLVDELLKLKFKPLTRPLTLGTV